VRDAHRRGHPVDMESAGSHRAAGRGRAVRGGGAGVIGHRASRLTGDRERGGDRRRLEGPSPLDIARERYARGEITREQFEQFRHDLK
jgi:hypothetical protein